MEWQEAYRIACFASMDDYISYGLNIEFHFVKAVRLWILNYAN